MVELNDNYFLDQNFSYSSIADVQAVAQEAREKGFDKASERLSKFASELESAGIAALNGKEFIWRPTAYGMEIVSTEDLETEEETEEE